MSAYPYTMQCCYKEQLAFAFYSNFKEPKLYRHAMKGEWDMIVSRCKSHPKEAAFRHKFAPYDTPLHAMLRPTRTEDHVRSELPEDELRELDSMRLAAVVALLEAHNMAAVEMDAFNRTPLHLACMSCDEYNADIVCAILRYFPKAASMVDVECRTPLHFLLARCEVVPLSVLECLLNAFGDALGMEDIVGETPFDIAERRAMEIVNYTEVSEMMGNVMPICCPRRKARRGSGTSTVSSSEYSTRSRVSVRQISR
jgi:ankyrin repeat protein